MASLKSVILSTGFVALAAAFTPPNMADQTFGALYTPDTASPVTQGQTYKVTWDTSKATAGTTVSLVLCSGPSSNCQLASTAIVEGLDPTTGSYEWAVPCSLPAVQSSATAGNGMLIIVDGTGQFQYSTQFSVNAGSSCSSSSSTTTTTSSGSTTTSGSTTSGSASTTVTSSWDLWNGTSTSTTSSKPTTAYSNTTMITSAKTTTSALYTLPTAANPTTTSSTPTGQTSPSAFPGAASRQGVASFGAAVVAAAVAVFAL